MISIWSRNIWLCCDHDSSNVSLLWNEIYTATQENWLWHTKLHRLNAVWKFSEESWRFCTLFKTFTSQISIKCLWLCRFGRSQSPLIWNLIWLLLFPRKTLNILVSICAQIEWSTEWGREGTYQRNIEETLRRQFGDININIEILLLIWKATKISRQDQWIGEKTPQRQCGL